MAKKNNNVFFVLIFLAIVLFLIKNPDFGREGVLDDYSCDIVATCENADCCVPFNGIVDSCQIIVYNDASLACINDDITVNVTETTVTYTNPVTLSCNNQLTTEGIRSAGIDEGSPTSTLDNDDDILYVYADNSDDDDEKVIIRYSLADIPNDAIQSSVVVSYVNYNVDARSIAYDSNDEGIFRINSMYSQYDCSESNTELSWRSFASCAKAGTTKLFEDSKATNDEYDDENLRPFIDNYKSRGFEIFLQQAHVADAKFAYMELSMNDNLGVIAEGSISGCDDTQDAPYLEYQLTYDKYVAVELPDVCLIADITNKQECALYVEKYVRIFNMTSTEQAATILQLKDQITNYSAQINSLNLTLQQKITLIANYTSQISDKNAQIAQQEILISALNVNLTNNQQLISQLQTNVTNANILISQLNATQINLTIQITQLNQTVQSLAQDILAYNLTIQQQAAEIRRLNLSVEDTARLINELTENLAYKAYLLTLLNVTNQEQAQLLANMSNSFATQGQILGLMNLTIEEDKAIINNLTRNNYDQGVIIANMGLINERQAALIVSVTDDITRMSEIIAGMDRTNAQLNALIIELQKKNSDLINLQNSVQEAEKKKPLKTSTLLLIAAAGVTLLFVFVNSRQERTYRRRR